MLPRLDLPHKSLSFQRAGEPVLNNSHGRHIFLRGEICKPNLLIGGVTDLGMTNCSSACQCRTVPAQSQCNPPHLMIPTSFHAADWENNRLSHLKVLDWSRLFSWTRFAFSGLFLLFPVECLLMYLNSFTSLKKGTWTSCILPYSHGMELE